MSVKNGRLIAVLALAAVAVHLSVVGLEKAKGLAAVMGFFIAACGLLAPYLAPVKPAPPSVPEPPRPHGGAGGSTVTISHCQGVSNGDGTTQNNTFRGW